MIPVSDQLSSLVGQLQQQQQGLAPQPNPWADPYAPTQIAEQQAPSVDQYGMPSLADPAVSQLLNSVNTPFDPVNPTGFMSLSPFDSGTGGGSGPTMGGFGGSAGPMGSAPPSGAPSYTAPTGYTGGAAPGQYDYHSPAPLYNGDPGSMTEYGLDPKQLETIGGKTMIAPAIQQLQDAQRQLGIPVIANIGGTGFRTRAEQVAMDPDGDGYGSNGQLVAPPGHSMHEAGRAVDINTDFVLGHPELRRWLDQHGWVNGVTDEPWHWEYQGPAVVQNFQPAFTPSWTPGSSTTTPRSSVPASTGGGEAPGRKPPPVGYGHAPSGRDQRQLV